MKFTSTLIKGKLIKRYKRFFTDIEVNNKIVTAHCPNTGSMMGLLDKNNDGTDDIHFVDTDGSLIADVVYVDQNFDNAWDLILFDRDENGIYEQQLRIGSTNSPNILFYDIEQDGSIDLCAFDKDKDNKPDRMMQIESCTESS